METIYTIPINEAFEEAIEAKERGECICPLCTVSKKLEEDELVGVFISEMALIDADGDVVAFSNFLAKGKDETEVTFTIEDNY